MDQLDRTVSMSDGSTMAGSRTRGSGKGLQEAIPLSEYRSGGPSPNAQVPATTVVDRSDTLRKIHAQSSAETSGLGDSLQRIHALSSTETSGYGETVPSPTAPSPSPDDANPDGYHHYREPAQHSDRDAPERARSQSPKRRSSYQLAIYERPPNYNRPYGHDQFNSDEESRWEEPGYGQVTSKHMGSRFDNPSYNEYHSHNPPRQGMVENAGGKRPEYGGSFADAGAGASFRSSGGGEVDGGRRGLDGYEESVRTKVKSSRAEELADSPDRPTSRNARGRAPSRGKQGGARAVEPSDPYDDLPSSSSYRDAKPRAQQVTRGGAEGGGADQRHQPAQDMISPTDSSPASRRGSTTSLASGLFLGVTVHSTWLKWSQDRRASFKRRLDSLEQRQKEVESKRMSTPVRKARKESVMFVSPALEELHLPDQDEHLSGAYHATQLVPVPPKRQRREALSTDSKKLSVAQWNALVAFWEHDLFLIARYAGLFVGLVSLVLGVISIISNDWMRYDDPVDGAAHAGLWQNCSQSASAVIDYQSCTIYVLFSLTVGIWEAQCFYNLTTQPSVDVCQQQKPYWQNAVIGLMIFAVAFGFLALVLSICGVCTSTLSKKIYYYHSAGEIHLICALSCTAALIVYPVAIQLEKRLAPHSYGFGYGLGWGSAFFFFASATCMCLDDIVRTLARGSRCCARSDADTRV